MKEYKVGDQIGFDEIGWSSDWNGDEVGYPEIDVVGLYTILETGQDVYIDSSNGIILEILEYNEL